MKTAATVAITAAAVLVLELAGALIVAVSGAYNVGAVSPHSGMTAWILAETSGRSIAVRAAGLTPPAAAVEAKGSQGFQEFDGNLCSMCHGAPGVEPSGIGKGLYPPPPDLSIAARSLSIAEIYWVIANGIGDSGMPAFRSGHKPDELWLIASYVKRLGATAKDEQRSAKAGALKP